MSRKTCPFGLLRIVPALVAAALLLIPAGRARACDCILPGPTFHAPRVADSLAQALAITSEVADLTCRPARRGQLACTWWARYVLARTVTAELPLLLAYPTDADVVVTFDGVQVSGPVRTEELSPGESQRVLTATWPEGQDTELVVELRAALRLEVRVCGCGDEKGATNRRRHPIVSRLSVPGYAVYYESQAQPASVRLGYGLPRAWRIRKPWPHSTVAGDRITRDVEKYENGLELGFEAPFRLDPGGPVAGVGLGFGPEGVRPRLRLGWELAWPRIWVHSLVVETDARSRVAVIPAWELTYPWNPHPLVPDVGVGVGVPIQLAPQARPGARLLARLGWMWCHLVGTVDLYPAFRGAPPERLGSILLQFGI